MLINNNVNGILYIKFLKKVTFFKGIKPPKICKLFSKVDCIILQQQWMRVLIASHDCQYLLGPLFLNLCFLSN